MKKKTTKTREDRLRELQTRSAERNLRVELSDDGKELIWTDSTGKDPRKITTSTDILEND